jgi:hypothetical protein
MRFLRSSEDSPLSQRSARRLLLSLTTLGSLLCCAQGFRPALALPQCCTSHAVADSAQPSEDADATNAAAAPPNGGSLSSAAAARRRPSAGSRPTTAAPRCPRPRASAHSRAGRSSSSPVAQVRYSLLFQKKMIYGSSLSLSFFLKFLNDIEEICSAGRCCGVCLYQFVRF